MITREQAKQIVLISTKDDMKKNNKTLDDICMMSPKIGRDSWTYREYIEATENDTDLDDCEGSNPIDMMLNYEKYLNEKGKSLLDTWKRRINP